MTAVEALDRWIDLRGPATPVSLARVLLALLLWCEHGPTERAFESLSVAEMAFSLGFWTLTTLMLLGLWARASTVATGALLLVGWSVLGEVAPAEQHHHHHTYFAAVLTLLLGLTPCGEALSVDRWRAVRAARASGRAPPAPDDALWALRLVQLQVCALYAFTTWDKLYPTFPERMESYFAKLYFGAQHPGPWFADAMVAAGLLVVLTEGALAVAVLHRRTIPFGAAVAVVLHGLIYWLFTVGTFSVAMLLAWAILLDPQRVGRALGDAGLGGRSDPAG